MDRQEALQSLDRTFDILIIGGGATGLGVALDSAARGYSTALVEARDFAHGASSRSTKLVHGGVRYLKQGNIGLVRGALHERHTLLANAPHLARELRFLVPAASAWETVYYATGLKLYDALAGRLNLTPARVVSAAAAREMVPTLATGRLAGGIVYSDAQFNDARLAIALARTACARGAAIANYARVEALRHEGGRVCGATVRDEESGAAIDVRARVVVNATGVETDAVRTMDEPGARAMVRPSQGIHIVLSKEFLPGDTAVMVPRTADGRVFFVIPWEGRTLIGTTDTPVDEASPEPVALEEEIAFCLSHAGRYLCRTPSRSDVLSVFAGLRPLVQSGGGRTSELSRDHTLMVSPSGLVTITGGKWTTYRQMAEETVDRAAAVAGLPPRPCPTAALPLCGGMASDPAWRPFGATDAEAGCCETRYPGTLHPRLPYTMAEAAYTIEHEMPVHLEDVLSRRLRALLLDAHAAVEAAPAVASLMARIQGHAAAWERAECERFAGLAASYTLEEPVHA